MSRMDINNDGYISREDYELMAKKLAEHSGMTGEQAETIKKEFLNVADAFNMKPGVKISVEEAAKKANEANLTMSPFERKTLLNDTHNLLFDAIDTNKDGYISLEEFKVYFNIIAPGMADDEMFNSFDTIDTDKNGEIR